MPSNGGGEFYIPPPTPQNTLLGVGGGIKEGGCIKFLLWGGGVRHIHPPPLPLNNAFWPKWGEGPGGLAREIGTICPFGVFSPVLLHFWAQFGGNPCGEASCGVVTFPKFYRHFRWFWGLGTPNPPFVLFWA